MIVLVFKVPVSVILNFINKKLVNINLYLLEINNLIDISVILLIVVNFVINVVLVIRIKIIIIENYSGNHVVGIIVNHLYFVELVTKRNDNQQLVNHDYVVIDYDPIFDIPLIIIVIVHKQLNNLIKVFGD